MTRKTKHTQLNSCRVVNSNGICKPWNCSSKPHKGFNNTVKCCYNAVWYNMILDTSLQELRQNINHRLNPKKTPHTSPWRARYGVSFVNILEKIDRLITTLHCRSPFSLNNTSPWPALPTIFWPVTITHLAVVVGAAVTVGHVHAQARVVPDVPGPGSCAGHQGNPPQEAWQMDQMEAARRQCREWIMWL